MKRKTPRVEAAPDTAEAITVLPGLGFKGFLTDDGRLQINQDDDNVVLSKTECKVLFAQFTPWVNAPDQE